jgi:hypothetical protein
MLSIKIYSFNIPVQTAMRQLLFLAAVAVAALVVSSCSQPKQQHTGPARIAIVGGDTVNWGKSNELTLKHRVVIENTGGDTLNIANVRPSCGCTTAPLSRNTLAPGDTASIDVSIDMKGRTGPQHKTITITSNDSARSNVVVTLMADMSPDMVVEPNFFPPASNANLLNREYETAVLVKNTGLKPLTIQPPTLVNNNNELKVRFDLTQAKEIAPGSSERLVAHVTPLKSGSIQNNVVLKTSSTNMPEVQLPLYLDVKPQ